MKISKLLSFSLTILAVSLLFSCKKKDEIINNTPSGELDGLQWVSSISNTTHKIDFYTANGKFETGYNQIYFQIKNPDGSLVNNATSSWLPVMTMMSMNHSCPFSAIQKKENASSTYGGYIVFQMAGNDMEYWEIKLNYTIDSTLYEVNGRVAVVESDKRRVQSFQGSDAQRYVLAMSEPRAPQVGINVMKGVVYRMATMMDFEIVDDYTIKIDPRMPGMGNHGSPNNIDLKQDTDHFYTGQLSLTMTGYWKINLILEDETGQPIKGEEVTPTNESSSIYFEVEF